VANDIRFDFCEHDMMLDVGPRKGAISSMAEK
jgi:hypothetical protein